MATTIEKPYTQTSLESRQSPVDLKSDEWNGDGISHAPRVSVITSTYDLPGSSEKGNDKINLIATSKPQEDKLGTSKLLSPYMSNELEISRNNVRYYTANMLFD